MLSSHTYILHIYIVRLNDCWDLKHRTEQQHIIDLLYKDRKTYLSITQVVGAFGMNMKVRGSSLLQVETFYLSKFSTLSQERPFGNRKWMLLRAHS